MAERGYEGLIYLPVITIIIIRPHEDFVELTTGFSITIKSQVEQVDMQNSKHCWIREQILVDSEN